VSFFIDDPKVIQKFVSELDKIDKIYRPIKDFNGNILIHNGVVLSESTPDQLPRLIKTWIKDTTKNKLVSEYFLNYTFAINCTEYFEFRKNKKDKLASIYLDNNGNICFTRINGEKLEFFIDHNKIVKKSNKIINMINSLFTDTIVDDLYMDIDNIDIIRTGSKAFKLIVDVDKGKLDVIDAYDVYDSEDGFLQTVLMSKFIKGIEYKKLKSGIKASDIKIEVKNSETLNHNLYLLSINIENDTITTKQSFIIIDI